MAGSGGGVNGAGVGAGSGGGGAALGAGIYVYSDALQIGTLVIEDGVIFSGNTLIAGVPGATVSPGVSGNPGSTLGTDIFLMSGSKLIFDIDTSFTMTSDIVSDSGAGGGNTALNGVIKQGLGTVTLEGQNTYTGNTIITNGTLINNGSLGPLNQTTVSAAGTLQGTGTLNGSLTVNGILSPGNSSSTLPIGGALVLNAGSQTVIAANSAGGSTLLNVTGSATLGGTLFINFDPGSYQFGQEFTVLTAGGGISGTFSMVLSSLGNFLKPVYTANSVQIIFE
jgi:autotransporter-associated beta strand protein